MTLKNISKYFIESNENKLKVLNNLSFHAKKSEKIAIIGPSGSGKTTLLSIMAGLDLPSSGEVIFAGEHLETQSEEELADMRNKKIGFIFQSFELIASFTALENVLLPLAIRNDADDSKAKKILKDVGLEHRMNHFPNQLSGGEKQRVAIARALIHKPEIIFADEPTGNLDEKTSKKVFELLISITNKNKMTLILITHSMKIAEQMDKIYLLNNGQLVQS